MMTEINIHIVGIGNLGMSFLEGFKSLKDYHTWHPSFKNLCLIIQDNGFKIEKVFWQPEMNDRVVYLQAMKSNNI